MLLVCCTVLVLLPLALGQDLSVPSSWRKDGTNLSRDSRVSIAQVGIDQLTPQLDPSSGQFNGLSFWQSGNAWSTLALNDLITRSNVNQASVTKNLPLVSRLNPVPEPLNLYFWPIIESFNDDALWWGTAALYGYRAYKDQQLLDLAITTWNATSQYFITADDAARGAISTKNFTVTKSCNGLTMAGGVFWQHNDVDPSINAVTTGLYMTLSAYLAEATADPKYLAAAKLSQEFIINHLYSNSLALDTISGQASDSCATSSPLFTYNSGKFIEGLSVLYSVTRESIFKNIMIDTVAAATHSSIWQGKDGIITEAANDPTTDSDGVGFKAIFIRGLYEAFSRNPFNTDLRILIHSYIDVQYNALLDLARTPGTNVYSAAWHGPPASSFTSWGQLAALDVLNSAIGANS